jgi:phage gp36-like protein
MYVTPAQLAEKPGANELAQVATAEHLAVVDSGLLDATLRGTDRSDWTVDEQAAADAVLARITEIIAEVDETIDGYLAKRVSTLPLSPVPKVLLSIARSFVRYELHKDAADREHPVVRDYQDKRRLLEAIAKGDVTLGIEDPTAEARAEGLIHTSSRARIFTRESLDGL